MQIELRERIGDVGVFILTGNMIHDASQQIIRCLPEVCSKGILCLHKIQQLNEDGLCGLAAVIIHFNLLGGRIVLVVEGEPLKDCLTKSGLSRLTRVFEEPMDNIVKVAQFFEL